MSDVDVLARPETPTVDALDRTIAQMRCDGLTPIFIVLETGLRDHLRFEVASLFPARYASTTTPHPVYGLQIAQYHGVPLVTTKERNAGIRVYGRAMLGSVHLCVVPTIPDETPTIPEEDEHGSARGHR